MEARLQITLNGVDNLDGLAVDGTPSWYTINIVYSRKFNNLKTSLAYENIFDVHYKHLVSGISSSMEGILS